METIKDIDQDVATLHEELDRHDGKRQFHCNKRCKYLLGIFGLILLMFLFGALTRPVPQVVSVPEVIAVLDPLAPRIVNPEVNERLMALHSASKLPDALVPTLPSTATEPRVLSWTPATIGKLNSDGSVASVTGTYEVPGGWYGIIRLVSDGKEIGATSVDARAQTTSVKGPFVIIPLREEGQHLVRLVFDAVGTCRITCAPTDQLCIATNANYCVAQADNQSFLTYTPALAEPLPVSGQCVTKTFVAGPKHAPQIPEDYTMCQKGMWNTNLVQNIQWWLVSSGLKAEEVTKVVKVLAPLIQISVGGQGTSVPTTGEAGNITWAVTASPGDAEKQSSCIATVVVSVNCTK